MQVSFLNRVESWQLTLIMLALMILSIFIGLTAGRRYYRKTAIDAPVLGGLFALVGFLLAFNFSLSLTHYEVRRGIIIEEANNIGTAILRTSLYHEPDRTLLRAGLKRYVNARINYFTAGVNEEKVMEAQRVSGNIQRQLWTKVSELSNDAHYTVASLQMTSALNNMIDITTTRFYANYVHLPDVIIYLLILLSCVSTFYMGFVAAGKQKFDWLLGGGVCLLIAVVVLVNLDLDQPRRGFITLDQANQSIVDLKQMFPEQEAGVK